MLIVETYIEIYNLSIPHTYLSLNNGSPTAIHDRFVENGKAILVGVVSVVVVVVVVVVSFGDVMTPEDPAERR